MTNPNDPAFPCASSLSLPDYVPGLTKREYFAAMAMQGILAQQPVEGDPDDLARSAGICADALIAELSK